MQKKPLLIDSHCHLQSIDLTDFNENLDEVMRQAAQNDVAKMLCVCIELQELTTLHQIAERFDNVWTSAGVHPNVEIDTVPSADYLIQQAQHVSCIAIGETGLDYFRTEQEEAKEAQREMFRQHIQASRTSGKPLIIHTRAAAADTIRLMKEESASEIGGVMHCFAEDWSVAKQALDLGFYISFSGIVTFKNAQALQEVAKKVPGDRMLIETDSPYLAPVPYRGKQNHPAYVKHVALALSELREVDYEEIAAQTTNNFYTCFRAC